MGALWWMLALRRARRFIRYLLLVRVKVVVLGSDDLWDEARGGGGGGAADGCRGQRVLRGQPGSEEISKEEKLRLVLNLCFVFFLCISWTTRSVVSSASGEWQELMLFLRVLLGLGHEVRMSGDAGPNPRDIWGSERGTNSHFCHKYYSGLHWYLTFQHLYAYMLLHYYNNVILCD